MELRPGSAAQGVLRGSQTVPLMPSLERGAYGHAHSVHSALVSLQALGISEDRVTLRRAGLDAHALGAVVRQEPAQGTPLTDDVRIQLHVAGLGFTHALPVGMWDSGGERAAGTQEILAVVDDPLEKLKHWFHEGAPLFRLTPENRQACARWLQLFGLSAEEWPVSLWFPLASVIADVPQLACSVEGWATVLHLLLDLPIACVRRHPTWTVMPEALLSRLGEAASRLGVDLLVGDTMEDLAMTEIELGPVSLEMYEYFAESASGKALLDRVLRLLMPLGADFDVRWSVQDRLRPPRLGIAAGNSRLGVNSHMGQEPLPASVLARQGQEELAGLDLKQGGVR